jgi:hypothetical protein
MRQFGGPMRRRGRSAFCLLAALALIAGGCEPGEEPTLKSADPTATVEPAPQMAKLTVFPDRVDADCGNGRAKIYDECGDQRPLFKAAFETATAENKILLVSYGAEWCIWCHVFDRYVAGAFDSFEYELPDEKRSMRERRTQTMAQEAIALNRFVSETFVIAHIESDYAPGGWDVLQDTGADAHIEDWIPFIFAVGPDGKIVAVFDHEQVELPSIPLLTTYRGYNRVKLLKQLQEMAEAARSAEPTDKAGP